jgi:uncharacterized coiled-coil DUF342 family protein
MTIGCVTRGRTHEQQHGKEDLVSFEKLTDGERQELADALNALYSFLNERILTLRTERDEAVAERDELRAVVARYRAGVLETDVAAKHV